MNIEDINKLKRMMTKIIIKNTFLVGKYIINILKISC